jgi:hypothetical protein
VIAIDAVLQQLTHESVSVDASRGALQEHNPISRS